MLEKLNTEDKILLNEIKNILEGIDKTEVEDVNGWWETSTGAEFGRDVMRKITILIEGWETRNK